ncbi:hypothetical protein HD806DRAFT_393521 [Xylariaceae sp. AK1471]|nr:hypothetical protein HD806DRAFT_393521 [Xylariaceae sp. AK1471]
MGSQAVQAQWSLNETSDSVYSIAKGVLQAATSDNVQPLALMACEQFGNTLAISRETRLKIERTVLPTPEPVTIRFLKAKVGLMKHDCAIQLGSNQAGLRFLALAATLVSSLDPTDCADALILMLETTTSDGRLLPTTRHLRDLMSALEPRCRLSGFADTVYSYHIIVKGAICARGLPYHGTPRLPKPEGLAALVDACRQLQRVGDHDISSIAVEAYDCVAWVAAFCKWSLELQPSVRFADGTSVISQPGSQLTIIILGDKFQSCLRVIKKFKIESIQDLITQSVSRATTAYRVKFETYCSLLRARCGSQKWARDAIFAALPLAIRLVRERMEPRGEIAFPPTVQALLSTQQLTITRPSAFPENSLLFKTMSLVLGLGPDFPFSSLASAESFWALPEVENFFHLVKDRDMGLNSVFPSPHPSNGYYSDKDILKMPWWANAKVDLLGSPDSRQPSMPSTLEFFNMKLGDICRSIILLSVFYNLEDLHFIPPDDVLDPDTQSLHAADLHFIILNVLTTDIDLGSFYFHHIWEETCRLLMETTIPDTSPDHGGILVKSTKTHVFWYSMLDDFVPRNTGYARLTSCRGRLMYERQVYDEVQSMTYFEHGGSDDLREFKSPITSVTQNLCPDATTQWRLTVPQGELHAELSLTSREDLSKSYSSVNPLMALNMLTSSRLVNCKHPIDGRVENDRSSWKYWAPYGQDLLNSPNMIPANLNIFPVGGVRQLQMYCLAWIGSLPASRDVRSYGRYSNVVVRQRACFDCCIQVCEATGDDYSDNYLIL